MSCPRRHILALAREAFEAGLAITPDNDFARDNLEVLAEMNKTLFEELPAEGNGLLH